MGEEHAEHLVGLSRIQRLMLSLMPKYCSITNWKSLVKETESDMVCCSVDMLYIRFLVSN